MAAMMVACSAAKPTQAPKSQIGTPPADAKLVHCVEPSSCYDGAKALCGGDWHQIAEPGVAFPAMIAEGNGRYRLLVVCGNQVAGPQPRRDDQEAQGIALARESAALDQVEAAFARLELANRWGDPERDLFQQSHAALVQVAREQEAEKLSDDSPRMPRVGRLVSREERIIQSPACKRSNAEVEEYNRRAQAEYYSPQAQEARADEQRQRQQDRDDHHDAQQRCEAHCPTDGARDMCIAGCQR